MYTQMRGMQSAGLGDTNWGNIISGIIKAGTDIYTAVTGKTTTAIVVPATSTTTPVTTLSTNTLLLIGGGILIFYLMSGRGTKA
jgi:predicted anti-sigma-YlaC factor YlaD